MEVPTVAKPTTHSRQAEAVVASGPIMPGPVKPQVRLVGEDGNAFAILGRVMGALRQAGYSAEEIARYRTEATSGDYHHLLRVTLEWVDEPDAYPTACEGSHR